MCRISQVIAVLLMLVLSMGALGQERTKIQWLVGSGSEHDYYTTAIQRFMTANPSIEVELLEFSSSSDVPKKLPVLVAAGVAPDVSRVDPTWTWGLIAQGLFVDLNPFIQKDPGFELHQFFPQGLEMFRDPQGQLWALPFDFSIAGLFYNEYLFDEAGLGYPSAKWTWENEFLEAHRKLTRVTPDGTYTQWGFYGDSKWYIPFYAMGGNLLSEDYREVLINRPASVAALDWIAQEIRRDSPRTSSGFAKNLTAMQAEGAYYSRTLNRTVGLRYNAQHFPTAASTGARATTLGGMGWAIVRSSKHYEECWRLLRYLTDFEAQADTASVRYAMPVRRDVGLSRYFLKPDEPPANRMIFVDATAYARFYPRLASWGDLESIMSKQLAPLWAGEQPASVVTSNIKTMWDAMLK